MELRWLEQSELRVTSGKLQGYAAVFDSVSREIPGVGREVVLPGAFNRSLREAKDGRQDVPLFMNHSEQYLLASVAFDTLELETDAKGLRFTATLPKTDYAAAVTDMVRQRGAGSSFAFTPRSENHTAEGVRQLIDVDLHHITIAKMGTAAYAATEGTIQARALGEYRSIGRYTPDADVTADLDLMARDRLRLASAQLELLRLRR